jgi:hypothetical protein
MIRRRPPIGAGPHQPLSVIGLIVVIRPILTPKGISQFLVVVAERIPVQESPRRWRGRAGTERGWRRSRGEVRSGWIQLVGVWTIFLVMGIHLEGVSLLSVIFDGPGVRRSGWVHGISGRGITNPLIALRAHDELSGSGGG